MNKKLWVGIYLASLLVVVAVLFVGAVLGVLLYDEVIHPQTVMVPMIAVGLLAYLQFVLVHTVITLMTLYKLWDAIQDGVTSVSPGKAVGFLFIPFYNLYWIFRVWAGYPKEHNEFLQRNKLNAPVLSGTLFTLFPILVLLTAILLVPILILPFFTLFLIARACDTVNNLNVAKAAAAEGRVAPAASFIGTPENPRSKLPAFALAGAFALVGVVLLIFGIFAGFNMSPTPTAEMVPQKVGDFTLQPDGDSSGSLLGGRKSFSQTYIAESGGKKRALYYYLNIYPSETRPRSWISSMCTSHPAEPIKDASGNEIGKICRWFEFLYLQRGEYMVRIQPPASYDLQQMGAVGATQQDMIDFAKALPINTGLSFGGLDKDLATPTSTSPTGPMPPPLTDSTAVARDAKPDFTFTADEYYRSTNGKDTATLAKYQGKIIQVTARYYSTTGSSVMLMSGKDSFFGSFEASDLGQFSGLKQNDRLTLKCVGNARGSLALQRCNLIENKGIISPDDVPDATFTAQQYWDTVASYGLPVAARRQKWDELRGKVVKITGTVKDISGNTVNLTVAKEEYVRCTAAPENIATLSGVAAGQNVTLLSVHGVTSLEHCIVVSK